MKLAVFPPRLRAESFLAHWSDRGHEVFVPASRNKLPEADLLIDAGFTGQWSACHQLPCLVHSPAVPLSQLPDAPEQVARFCAWPGFAERELWEIATVSPDTLWLDDLMAQLGQPWVRVPDVPGLIAPRVLANLVNEAAWVVADGISSEEDVDTAMKLGTNYPKGPVEWGREIGFGEIRQVLEALQKEDDRYQPHPLLREWAISEA